MTTNKANPGVHRDRTLQGITDAAKVLNTEVDAATSKIERAEGNPAISIPASLTYRSAIEAIEKHAEAEESETVVSHVCDNKHWASAGIALQELLSSQYGCDFATPKPGLFGPTPPRQVTVPLDADTTTTVVLGEFHLAGMRIETRVSKRANVERLMVFASVRNYDKHLALRLFRQLDAAPDVYAGQFLVFDNTNEEPRVPQIKRPQWTLDNIALNSHESTALQMFIDQIRHHDTLATEHGIVFKRGVLLYGPYGTGKTLAASVAISECIAAGITVIQERNWSCLYHTMQMARTMQPCMIFCEDIDQIHDRALTNILDDASLKTCAMSLVVTTNFPEKLDPALTRTGRLDICIGFDLPGEQARQKILSINGCDAWDAEVCAATAGMTGSDMAEVAKRAIIRAHATGTAVTAEYVLGAAITMKRPPEYVAPDPLADAVARVGAALNRDSQVDISCDEFDKDDIQRAIRQIDYIYDRAD